MSSQYYICQKLFPGLAYILPLYTADSVSGSRKFGTSGLGVIGEGRDAVPRMESMAFLVKSVKH